MDLQNGNESVVKALGLEYDFNSSTPFYGGKTKNNKHKDNSLRLTCLTRKSRFSLEEGKNPQFSKPKNQCI